MRSHQRFVGGPGAATAPVEQLDQLISARPADGQRLPVFLCSGAGAEEFVRGFADRLVDHARRPLLPHALVPRVDPAAAEPDVALLDSIANRLQSSTPRAWGPLRLPSYWLLRAVLEAHVHGTSVAERQVALRDWLFERRGQMQPETGWFGRAAAGMAKAEYVGPVSTLTSALPRFVFGRRLAHGRPLRWLGEAMTGDTGGGGQLDAALCLVKEGQLRHDRALVRRLLVQALLIDLERATRRRRRRLGPFVVLLPDGAPELLASLGELDDPWGRATLLVIAAADTPLSMRRRETVPLVLSAGEAGGGPKAPRRRPRPRVALPLIGASAAVVMGFVLLRSGSDGPCSRISTTDGTQERVGVGDGTAACSFFPEQAGLEGLDKELNDKHQAVERRLAEANEAVIASADGRYQTIVFFAPLGMPTGSERAGQSGLNQFRGIALAQEEANRRALNNRAQVPLRVILANSGDRFAQGVDVAEQIVDLAEEDETVVGVVGITQSRIESRAAIGVLGAAGLPVVAGPVTGDQMLDEAETDRIYQVTARNDRIADLLVDFATSVPIVGPATAPAGSSELEMMQDAVIVFDPDDEYSENLSDDFERELVKTTDATGRARVVADRIGYRADDGGESASLTHVAIDTCDALSDEHDIVFFASRAQQLPGFLDGLAETACADRGVTLVGGPDLTKFVQDPRVPLAHNYDFLRFYYSAHLFDTPELRRQVAFSSETVRFLTAYRADYPPESPTFDVADPANAYDALWAMKVAIDLAADETSGPDDIVTGDLVTEALASGDVAFEGASGYIAFDRIGKHIPADKPVLVVNLPIPFNGHNRRVEMLCGRLTADQEPTAWGIGPEPCTPDD